LVADSNDFRKIADSVFETLLTVTTILSGTYIAITFNWFSQYMMTPTDPRMIELAVSGNILGLMFILPLVIVLVGWAFSKLRDSFT
jgi:Mn2+/Fe2+ NRAMP family transporter